MISFSCAQCGMKLQVKPEFAGRSSRCPTCKHPLVVPVPDKTLAVRPGEIEGSASSLAQAGVDGGVTLAAERVPVGGQKSIQELLSRRTKKGERYIIEQELARGGMGAVLRAVDCDIRREVAVKYLLDQSDAGKKLRFIEEAQITGQLEHPNIVPIHELGVDGKKRVFFSMKMVKGRSLAQVLDELRQQSKTATKEWSLGRLLGVFINACNALAYAHSRGVVHRDLKPANIMVGDFGEVYVMDWGLAKVLKGSPAAWATAPTAAQLANVAIPVPIPLSPGPTSSVNKSGKVQTSREPEADLTQEGAVLGTPAYMPPEQATGKHHLIDARSDVYSLGAILYEMLALLAPVDREGGYLAVLMRVMAGEIVPPAQRNRQRARSGHIPGELSAVAMKALALDPRQRYQSVEALRQDIERFQEGRSVSAKADTTREMLVKFARRNKAFTATASAALVVLLVVVGFTIKNYASYVREQREKQTRTKQAVPAFLRAARLAINERQFKDALDQATVAVDFDPDNADARLLKGELLIVRQQFPEARAELEECLKLRPGDALATRLAKLCSEARRGDESTCLTFADIFTEQQAHGLADGMTKDLGANTVDARNRILARYRKRIEAAWPGLSSRLTMDASGKFSVEFGDCGISDLAPLQGMRLSFVSLERCPQVRDLTPLQEMPLTYLNLMGCNQVRDLSPLRGMPLTTLNLSGCAQVPDLSPLQGMRLSRLDLSGLGLVRDFGPLKNMPLTSLNLHGCARMQDLSPLRGMRLTYLDLHACGPISDLSPLERMPLKSLFLTGRPVSDLSPLKGMPLEELSLHGCQRVTDLRPLEGMPLTSLDVAYCTQLHSLVGVNSKKLSQLSLQNCQALEDLTALRGLPVTHLNLLGCDRVRDLTALQGMNLVEISFVPRNITTGIDVLRAMKSLKTIGVGQESIQRFTPEVFWKKYNAREFDK